MLDPKEVNYKKLGFHAGLEIHHQLKSTRKLFCHCPPIMVNSNETPDYRFERYFRPVLGEMGDFDPGMLIEYEKGYRCIYHAFERCNCIYEQDEQPPFWPDQKSLLNGYELGHWFDCSALVDEVIFARKQYLDGSITTGFQRTTIVARDGYAYVDGIKHRISNITIEEDSARKIKTENNGRTVYYNLDRLGIPLAEIITDHTDIDTPKDLLKLAKMIGLTFRISGIGRRGIGTARQDVNISIRGGDRVELKGVQVLSMFEKWCLHETLRQNMLIEIAQMLKNKNFKKNELEHTYIDLSELFSNIPKETVIMGIRLPKFGNILGLEIQPGKDFGIDIMEKASLISGIPMKDMFISNEMDDNAFRKQNKIKKNYFFSEITKKIDAQIKKLLNLTEKDSYFLALGSQKWVIHAMKKVIERAKMSLDGVPQETRKATMDGNSEFLRVIHGKDRLYPDTDTPMIDMDMEKIYALKNNVKKKPWVIEEEYKKKYNFNFNQIESLIRHGHLNDFEKLVEIHGIEPIKAYTFLEETLIALRRKGIDPKDIKFEDYTKILKKVKDGFIDHSIIPKIIEKKCDSSSNLSIEDILIDMNIGKIDETKLENLFNVAIKNYKDFINNKENKNPSDKFSENDILKYKINKITGFLMKKTNKGIPGNKIHNFVKSKLEVK